MSKTPKMNFLYKTAFILLVICIPLFLIAIAVAYLLEEIYLSAIFSAGGAFLAFVGIILAMLSKPKKVKKKTFEQSENMVDNNR